MGINRTLDKVAAWAACGLALPTLGLTQAAATITGVLRTMKPEDEAAKRVDRVATVYVKVLQASMGLVLRHGIFGAQLNRAARLTNYKLAAELASAFLSTSSAKVGDIAQFVESMVELGNEVMSEEDRQTNMPSLSIAINSQKQRGEGNPMHTINWHEE